MMSNLLFSCSFLKSGSKVKPCLDSAENLRERQWVTEIATMSVLNNWDIHERFCCCGNYK